MCTIHLKSTETTLVYSVSTSLYSQPIRIELDAASLKSVHPLTDCASAPLLTPIPLRSIHEDPIFTSPDFPKSP